MRSKRYPHSFVRTLFIKTLNSSLFAHPKRQIALGLLIIWGFQQPAFASPPVVVPQAIPGAASPVIPREFGILEKEYRSPNGSRPLVIHIQDAHANPEAQRNIEKILQALVSQKAVDQIALESAFGPLDPSLLPAGGKQIAEKLADKGEITGAELFALTPESRGISFSGAEDKELYFASWEILKDLKLRKDEWKKLSKKYESFQEEYQRKYLNPALHDFLLKQKLWMRGEDEKFIYLAKLAEYSKKYLKLDLEDAKNQFEWPQMVRVVVLRRMEKEEKPELVRSEISELQDLIENNLKTNKHKKLILETLKSEEEGKSSFSSAGSWRQFFEMFFDETKQSGINLLQYPNFLNHSGRLILQGEMSATELLSEVKKLEPKVERKLLRSHQEEAFLVWTKGLDLIRKLLSLELSREEYEKYLTVRNTLQPAVFQKQASLFSPETALPLLDQKLIDKAEKFYALSLQRDQALIQNALKNQPKKLVLVTGGFHAAGIQAYLEKKNISYLSIQPKMTSVKTESFYDAIMTGQDLNAAVLKSQLGAAVLLQHMDDSDPRFKPLIQRQQILLQIEASKRKSRGFAASNPVSFNPLSAGVTLQKEFISKRAEVRQPWDPDALHLFDLLPEGELKMRLKAAIDELEMLKADQEGSLQKELQDSLPRMGPPRMISVIERITHRVYEDFNLWQLPLAYRAVFVLAVFDNTDRNGLSAVHDMLFDMIKEMNIISYTSGQRLHAADYRKFMRFVNREHLHSIDLNILIQSIINRFLIDLPRIERRALEKEALLREMQKELKEQGSGNIPEMIFLTDLHGGIKVGDLIAYAFGVQNYRNVKDIADLERRLANEKISVESKNITFVGGSDYVDRGPKPYRAFTFIKWLRAHGKLKFINGNHDLWKDWNMVGVHLRVNDLFRDIGRSHLISDESAGIHFEKVQKFVSVFGKSDEEKRKIDEDLHRLILQFLAHVRNGEVTEELIQQFADEVIDSGANPNHSLEWWSREWYDHAGWADMFLDEINETLINGAIQQLHNQLDDSALRNLENLLNRSGLPEVLKQHKEAILSQLKQGRIFAPVEAGAFSNNQQVKFAKEEIEKLKKENALIRAENETLAAQGRLSEMKRQHKVPTTFPVTAEMAAQYYKTLQDQVKAFQELLGKDLSLPDLQLVNPHNYRSNKFVAETALWNLKNFRLVYVDIYGNAYLHGIIPINSDSDTFKVKYRGRKGVEAIEYMQYDIRRFFEQYDEIPDTPEFRQEMESKLGEAFRILDEWYSDVTAYLKPPSVKAFLDKGGPSAYSYTTSSAYSPRSFDPRKGVIHVGHIDLEKMRKEKLPYWINGMAGGFVTADHDLSEGYHGLGAVFTHFMRMPDGSLSGMRRFGYEKTLVSLHKEIKDKSKKLKDLESKKNNEKTPEVSKKIEKDIVKLKTAIGDLQTSLVMHQKKVEADGGETIQDITLYELPQAEQQKIQPFLDGRDALIYYINRFTAEIIQAYEELIPHAQSRGRKDRVSYYESKLSSLKNIAHENQGGISATPEEAERLLGLPEKALTNRYNEKNYEVRLEFAPQIISSRFIAKITFILKSSPKVEKSYWAKKPRLMTQNPSAFENSAALYAHEASLGPEVLFESSQMIIEEYLPQGYELNSRGLLISPEESSAFGGALANAFHKMVMDGKYLYFGQVPQTHIFLLGGSEEEDFKIKFVDWSLSAPLDHGDKEALMRETLQQFAFTVKTFLGKPRNNVIAWAKFQKRLKNLEKELPPSVKKYSEILEDLQKSLTKSDQEAHSWQEFYQAIDRLPQTGLLEEGGLEVPGMDVQGKRSLGLILRNEAGVSPEIAEAIANDLIERGFIERNARFNPDFLKNSLDLFLDGLEFSKKEALIKAFEEELNKFAGNIDFYELKQWLPKILGKNGLEYAKRESQKYLDYLLYQEARRVTIQSSTLPNMRNRTGKGEILEVKFQNIKEPLKTYVVKEPHNPNELNRSQVASDLNLGPHVIYTKKEKKWRSSIIVEDYLPENRNILKIPAEEFLNNPQARGILAENVALKLYRMIDPKRAHTVLHKFDNYPLHMFVLSDEESFDFKMIDWALPNSIERGNGAKSVSKQIADILDAVYDEFKKFGPNFWQQFRAQMIYLARQNNAFEREIEEAFSLVPLKARAEIRKMSPEMINEETIQVALLMTGSLISSENLIDPEIWAKEFYRNFGKASPSFLGNTKLDEVGLQVTLVEQLPSAEDSIYVGLAQLLLEEPHRHIRVVSLQGEEKEAQAINFYFEKKFGHIPALRGRFKTEVIRSGARVQNEVERMIQQARTDVRKLDGVNASSLQFYKQVTVSSANHKILDSLLLPVVKTLDNVGQRPGVRAHLIRSELRMVQGLLPGEKIKHLGEVFQRHGILLGLEDVLLGEDLSHIEQLFQKALAQHQLLIAA